MHTEPIDRVLLLLIGCTMVFCGMLFASDKWFAGDQQLFTIISGLATGFGGAVLGRIKPSPPAVPGGALPGTTVDTTTVAKVHQEGTEQKP